MIRCIFSFCKIGLKYQLFCFITLALFLGKMYQPVRIKGIGNNCFFKIIS